MTLSGEPIILGLVSLAAAERPQHCVLVGSPDVFRLRKEPINSLSCVRTFVREFGSYSLDRSIFFSDFLHEVRSPYHFDDQ